ncbi:MAG TPA: MFS transporter [Ktedonobacterales bacterium]|nr:MFS transporter [Ktedonobacterales bacterium]
MTIAHPERPASLDHRNQPERSVEVIVEVFIETQPTLPAILVSPSRLREAPTAPSALPDDDDTVDLDGRLAVGVASDAALLLDAPLLDAPLLDAPLLDTSPLEASLFDAAQVEMSAPEVLGPAQDASAYVANDARFGIEAELADASVAVAPPTADAEADAGLTGATTTTDARARTRPALGARRKALAQVVILGAIWVDTLLYGIVVPFLPGYARALGATPAEIGLLFAVYAASLLVMTFPAAWLTDRVGARWTLLLGVVALFASTLLFGYSPTLATRLAETLPGIAPHVATLGLLFVARAFQGVAAAAAWTAGLAILAQLYPGPQRAATFARVGVAVGVGTLLGPPLGGALYTLGGFQAPFLFIAGVALLDVVGRLFFLPGRARLPVPQAEPNATRSLLRIPAFVLALVATGLGDLMLTALEPTLPPLLTRRLGLTPLWIGVLFAGVVVAFTLAQLLVARWTRLRLLIIQGLLACGAAFFALARSQELWQASLALLLFACALAFVQLPALSLLSLAGEHGRDPQRVPYGAIYGTYTVASSFGGVLGPIIAGTIVSFEGVRISYTAISMAPLVVLLGVGIVALVLRIRAWVSRRRMRRAQRAIAC